MTTAATNPDPIAALWSTARAWLADALYDFRGPAEVARVLAREVRAAIKSRLARLEALLMKLLLIEAARLPNPTTCDSPCRHTPSPAHRRPALHAAEYPADPKTWRVRFTTRIPPDPQARRGARQSSGLQRPIIPHADPNAARRRAQAKARKLARRFEALRRVLTDPRRAITALARKLRALGVAARAAAHRIALARPPRSQREGPDFANAIVYAHDAGACFPDTS